MSDTEQPKSIIGTYQAKLKEVAAVRLPPELDHETYLVLMDWLPKDQVIFYLSINSTGRRDNYTLHIEQPAGKIIVLPGQWVVKEDGQYFRMLDDGFRGQYEVSDIVWE